MRRMVSHTVTLTDGTILCHAVLGGSSNVDGMQLGFRHAGGVRWVEDFEIQSMVIEPRPTEVDA